MRKKLVQTSVVISLVFMAVLLFGCGKKGPLVMQPDLTPPGVENLEISQEGLSILLKWNFPDELEGKIKSKDKKKKEFLLENIKKIHILYSEKEILHGKFLKKSKVIRKLQFSELEKLPKASKNPLEIALSTKKKKKDPNKNDELEYVYRVRIPFQLKDLADNKLHFFGVQYFYNKKKSLISKVVNIHTTTPVLAVTGLEAKKENKVVNLRWNRPTMDAANNPVNTIAGYKVFRKVEAEKNPNDENQAEVPNKPVFVLLSEKNILVEYYQDIDTGLNGKYSYYVTAVMNPNVESAPCQPVTIDITDTYPPEIPANLVSFKASGHMFLTWQEVPDTDLAKYKVYRRTSSEQEFTLLADDVLSNQFKDTKVNPDVTYEYVVTAVDLKGNESQFSNSASERY